jgi:ataxin-10
MGSADEVIAPHQTTLLKLLDSYLQSSHPSSVLVGMCPMLTACFFELSTFSQEAVSKAIGKGSMEDADGPSGDCPPETLDLLLPKACEALVLVTQCIVSIMLTSERLSTSGISENDLRPLFRDALSSRGNGIAVSTIGRYLRQAFLSQRHLTGWDRVTPTSGYFPSAYKLREISCISWDKPRDRFPCGR